MKLTAVESAGAAEEERNMRAPIYRGKERAQLTCTRREKEVRKIRGRNVSISLRVGSAYLRTRSEGGEKGTAALGEQLS